MQRRAWPPPSRTLEQLRRVRLPQGSYQEIRGAAVPTSPSFLQARSKDRSDFETRFECNVSLGISIGGQFVSARQPANPATIRGRVTSMGMALENTQHASKPTCIRRNVN
jgi:hypothetical protein